MSSLKFKSRDGPGHAGSGGPQRTRSGWQRAPEEGKGVGQPVFGCFGFFFLLEGQWEAFGLGMGSRIGE